MEYLGLKKALPDHVINVICVSDYIVLCALYTCVYFFKIKNLSHGLCYNCPTSLEYLHLIIELEFPTIQGVVHKSHRQPWGEGTQ